MFWPVSRCPNHTGPAWAAPSNGDPELIVTLQREHIGSTA
jgi:hypothetical protein